jgi:hypothetical protein
MTEWGLSATGFKPKTFAVIKEEIENELRKAVDPNLRFTPDTIAGQLTGIMANQIRQVWEMAAGLYASLDSSSATGKALDALCQLTGTYRKQATPSRSLLKLTLAPGATLPQGIIVADENNAKARFRIQAAKKNETDKEASFLLEANAEETGPLHVKAGQLTKIITPHAGLIAVANPEDAQPGTNTESDADLRLRRFKELSAQGSATHRALISRLLRIKGVDAAFIEEGDKEFSAYVLGGDEQQIAETIWYHKPLGIHTKGSIAKDVKGSNGETTCIRFNRPSVIKLFLDVKVKVKQPLSHDELTKLKYGILHFCKEKFSFGYVPYASQFYPVLLAQEKIVDVTELRLESNNQNLPKVIKPHEVFSIVEEDIFVEQTIEVLS